MTFWVIASLLASEEKSYPDKVEYSALLRQFELQVSASTNNQTKHCPFIQQISPHLPDHKIVYCDHHFNKKYNFPAEMWSLHSRYNFMTRICICVELDCGYT